MEPLNVLDDLRIASPCPASWEGMRGDARVRFCEACSKRVYNVSDLTAEAALALIRGSEGRACVRLYRRRDGTVLTADCPVGLRSALRRRLLRMATAGVLAAAVLRAGVSAWASPRPWCNVPAAPSGPGVTFSDWIDWAAVALGLRAPTQVTMGDVSASARLPGTPPSPGTPTT